MGSLVSKTQIRYFWKGYSKWALKNYEKDLQPDFHIVWELRLQILKNYEDKAKRPLLKFVKVLQKYSLTQIKILYSLWNCTNYIKSGENQQRVVCEEKHKHVGMFGIMIPSLLSKIILGFCNMVCHILWGFRGKIRKIH